MNYCDLTVTSAIAQWGLWSSGLLVTFQVISYVKCISSLMEFHLPVIKRWCNISAVTLSVGRQEGHPACNSNSNNQISIAPYASYRMLSVDMLVVVIWLELCTSCSSSCHCCQLPSRHAAAELRMIWHSGAGFTHVVIGYGPLNECNK